VQASIGIRDGGRAGEQVVRTRTARHSAGVREALVEILLEADGDFLSAVDVGRANGGVAVVSGGLPGAVGPPFVEAETRRSGGLDINHQFDFRGSRTGCRFHEATYRKIGLGIAIGTTHSGRSVVSFARTRVAGQQRLCRASNGQPSTWLYCHFVLCSVVAVRKTS
jgi:hypothetical protein